MNCYDVQQIRKDLGMDPSQFARLLNVDARSVRNWETGKSKPNAAAEGVLIGLWETMKVSYLKGVVREYTNSAAAVGGLAYLIIRLFKGIKQEQTKCDKEVKE